VCTIGPSGSNLTRCSVEFCAACKRSEKNLCRLKANSSRATGVAGGSCMPLHPPETYSPSSSSDSQRGIEATTKMTYNTSSFYSWRSTSFILEVLRLHVARFAPPKLKLVFPYIKLIKWWVSDHLWILSNWLHIFCWC